MDDHSPSHPPSREAARADKRALVQAMKYAHIGLILPVAVVAGLLLGSLLDRWLGTSWIRLAGLFLGIVAGFYDLIRTAMKLNQP